MDWKSGGDTNFAPIASADGELDCRGFWDKGKTDKDALWTSNAEIAPTLRDYVASVGANFGRVRIIKLEPQDREQAMTSIHRDDNNRFNPDGEGWVVRSWVELTDNPDSYMLLMDNGARRPARPGDRAPRAAAPGRPLRRRHPAPVARGGAQRHRSPLRVDHQLREWPRARDAGSTPSAPTSPPDPRVADEDVWCRAPGGRQQPGPANVRRRGCRRIGDGVRHRPRRSNATVAGRGDRRPDRSLTPIAAGSIRCVS